MTQGSRNRALLVVMVSSLLLNLICISYVGYRVVSRGGISMYLARFNLADAAPTKMDFQVKMRNDLLKLPKSPEDIIFIGDSLIGDGPWAELFTRIKKQGIGGETSTDLLLRIDAVAEGHPNKVFLLIGANDLSAEVPADQVYRNYEKILDRLHTISPQTQIYVIGITPVRPGLIRGSNYTNDEVRKLNERIRGAVEKTENAEFIDLSKILADADGNLRSEWTKDGLHLDVEAYLAIAEHIKSKVEGPGTPAAPAAGDQAK